MIEQDATPMEHDAPDTAEPISEPIEATLVTLTAEQQAEVLHLAGLDGEDAGESAADAGEATLAPRPRPLPNKHDVKMAERAAQAALHAINQMAASYGRKLEIDANRLQLQARAQSMGELLVAKGICTEQELALREYELLTETLHAVRRDIEQQLLAQREQQEREQGPDAARRQAPPVQAVRTPGLVGADGRPVRR